MTKIKQKNTHFTLLAVSAIALGLLVVFLNSTSTSAGPFSTAGNQTNRSKCTATGPAVINVNQKIVNDADSGQAGNYWGMDTFTRHIQVFKQKDGTYCALVDYQGQYEGTAGETSPGKTGTLTGDETGTIKGGYTAVINGTLKDKPELATKGSIGTTDYKCDNKGNCPGAFNWTEKYFNTAGTTFTFSYSWWGWTYHSHGGNHTWVNSSDGNSGDII